MGKIIQLWKGLSKAYPYPGFPIGAIYFSMTNTNPSNYFGGTWSLIAPGRVLVGVDTAQTEFNTVRKSGGSKFTETHKHPIYRKWQGQGFAIPYSDANPGWNLDSASGTLAVDTGSTGTGNSGNLQPYLTCYIWERTS